MVNGLIFSIFNMLRFSILMFSMLNPITYHNGRRNFLGGGGRGKMNSGAVGQKVKVVS